MVLGWLNNFRWSILADSIDEFRATVRLRERATRGAGSRTKGLLMVLLAYNLTNWFKRLCLPPPFQNATLQILRQKILLMPAQLVRTGNRARLNLPASGHRELA